MKKVFTEGRLYKGMMGIILMMFLMMSYNLYLKWWPMRTLEINSIEILTPEISAGGVLKYKVDYCKYTDAISTAYRTVYNVDNHDLRYPQPPIEGASVAGCHVTTVKITLEDIPAGEYYVNTRAVYHLNEVRDEEVNFITPNFKINE